MENDEDLEALYVDYDEEEEERQRRRLPLRKVPAGDLFEAARAGDVDRLRHLVDSGADVNRRDAWDSTPLYYACLTGHLPASRLLLEGGAICSEHTFDGDRCHYAALNLSVRKLLKLYEARPPPLAPLPAALRDTFLACPSNQPQFDPPGANLATAGSSPTSTLYNPSYFPPDVTFFVQGRPIEAHRVVLSARSSFFKSRFLSKWKDRREVRFSGERLSYAALYSLIHFLYSDRLEVLVDEIENLIEICKVCKCDSLHKVLEKEMVLLKHGDYKALGDVDSSQKRFILQGLSLPEEDRLPAGLYRLLQLSLAYCGVEGSDELQCKNTDNDQADVCVKVEDKSFRCHQVILASRSEYFKARLSRMSDFSKGRYDLPMHSISLPVLEEHDLSSEALEKMIEYMYTDHLKVIEPDQAAEIFDVASRYMLFPLKRVVADALVPHLETATPADLCRWLILSDMYGVFKIREYCLDMIACNFETFADTPEFGKMLLMLPPPSGDSSLRTTLPSAPGTSATASGQANVLDDLREKWLEAEAAELDKRDESAALFDQRLEVLMLTVQHESSEMVLFDDA